MLRGMTLSYTADNRLASVPAKADYKYNGLGQRVYRLVKVPGAIGQGSKRSYIYGRRGELLAELGPTGQVTREYVYLNGEPLAMLEQVPASNEPVLNGDFDGDGVITLEDLYEWYFLHYNTPSGPDPAYDLTGDSVNDSQDMNVIIGCINNVGSCQASVYDTNLYYIHNDHLGTPKALTDEAGTKVWLANHTPFGQATVDEDPDGDGQAVVFNLRFPGQYYDRETGLHYNYHRYYDPATGRYITSDPIGLEGGPNTYLYAQANPLRFSDPLGLLSGRPEIPDWFPPPTFPDTLGECQTQKQEAIVKKCLVISNVTEKIACIDAWRDWELSCIGERACLPDDSKRPS